MAIVAGNFKRISNNGAGPLYRSLILFISFLIISCGGGPSSSKLTENSLPPATQPEGKISTDLLKKLDSNAITSANGFKVAIKLKEGEDISDVIDDSNVRYRANSLVNAVFVDLDRASILRLADDKRVEKIEENSDVKINLFYATKQTGARDVWTNYGINGGTFSGTANKIRLGVIDTGIDDNHLDFAGRIAKKVNCYQVPTCIENSGYKDDHGHGSHVAGIVLGSGASCVEASDTAYIELHGNLSDVSTATRYFFPAQFQTTPSGNLSVDMTWTSSIATTGSIGFQAKADAEALNNAFLFSYSQATSSGPSVAPGTFLSSGTWPISDGVAGVQLMPHSFVPSTTDTNAIGKEFWARVHTVAQGWGDSPNPRMAGMSYGAELVAVKSLNASGSGGIDDIVRSLEYIGSIAEINNIIAVNLSFSIGNGVSSDVLKSAARGLVIKGVAVIVSAGNEQQDGFNISSPGDEPTVITVGAVNDQNQVTSYSSIGSLASSPLKPDVLAPGGSFITRNYIVSAKTTYIDSKWNRASDASITVDPYALKIGTSQAAPFVTGLIGLMASKGTTTWTFNSASLPLQYKMLMCMTAFETGSRESSSVFFGAPTTPERAGGLKDRVEGYGRIDARGALSAFDGGSLTDPFVFGPKTYDQKSFARELSLSSDNEYNFTMAVPAGADYDLYLFNGTADN
ncbi:MAG: S8 family serine peptidase, partial [bacterium]